MRDSEILHDGSELSQREDETPADRLARERGLFWGFWVLFYPGAVSVLSVMPILALGPLAFAIRQDFPLSVSDIGIITSGFFLGSAVFASVGAAIARRVRSVFVVRGGVLLSGGLAAGIALGDSRAALIVGCLLAGVANGITAPAVNLVIMQLVPLRRRGLAFGIKTAAIPAAASIGAAATWSVATFDFHWQWLYLGTAGLSVVLVGAAVRFGAGKVRDSRPRSSVGDRRTPVSLKLIGIGGLLGSIGTGVLPPFLVEGLVSHGESPATAAKVLALGGWIGIIARLAVGVFADKYPRPVVHFRIAIVMLSAGSIGMAGIAFGGSSALLAAASLLAFGFGWSWPGLFHFAVLSTYRENQATATSFVQTGTFVGAVVGPTMFGLIADMGGFAWAWSVAAASVIGAAALLHLGTVRVRREGLWSVPPPNSSRS